MNPEEMQETPQQAIERYTTDFTKLAADGKLDPVIGREDEIRRTVQVLTRRTKNNPVLIGNPGVGKTAIIEGLATRIISGDVPENLQKKKQHLLFITTLHKIFLAIKIHTLSLLTKEKELSYKLTQVLLKVQL